MHRLTLFSLAALLSAHFQHIFPAAVEARNPNAVKEVQDELKAIFDRQLHMHIHYPRSVATLERLFRKWPDLVNYGWKNSNGTPMSPLISILKFQQSPKLLQELIASGRLNTHTPIAIDNSGLKKQPIYHLADDPSLFLSLSSQKVFLNLILTGTQDCEKIKLALTENYNNACERSPRAAIFGVSDQTPAIREAYNSLNRTVRNQQLIQKKEEARNFVVASKWGLPPELTKEVVTYVILTPDEISQRMKEISKD